MDLTLEQVQEFIEQNKDSEEVSTYLKKLSTPTVDDVKGFLEGDEQGQALLQSLSDSRVTQGIESFKQKTMPKLIEQEITKRNPQETEEQKRIRQLEEYIQQKEAEATFQTQKNEALNYLNEKKLPSSLVDYFVGDSSESTQTNLQAFEEVFTTQLKQLVDEQVKERINNSSYTPPSGDNNNSKKFTLEQVKAMSEKEITENWDAVQETLSQNK